MTPRRIYTLEYIKEPDGWSFIITSYSGRQLSSGYKTKKEAKQAAMPICQMIRAHYKLVRKRVPGKVVSKKI